MKPLFFFEHTSDLSAGFNIDVRTFDGSLATMMRSFQSDDQRVLLDQRLLESIQSENNYDQSTSLLAWGARSGPIDDKTGKAAIHFAAEQNDFHMLRRVIASCPSEINCRTRDGDSPLHCSLRAYYPSKASIPYTKILKIFLDYGADVNARNHKGQTPLHIALTRNPNPVFDEFCKFEIFNDSLADFVHDCVFVIKMLLDKGANASNDYQGRSPIHYITAYATTYVEVFASFFQPYNYLFGLPRSILEHCDKDGLTPLHAACQTGNLGGVQWCVMQEADVNAQDKLGRTPLHFACDYPNSSVDHVVVGGWTPADRTAYNNYRQQQMIEIADHLIEFGAGVAIRNNNGETCLAWACRNRNMKLMSIVINGSVDLNINVIDVPINEKGETCLHVECRLIRENIAKELLLDFAADPNKKDHEHHTALDLALAVNNLPVVPYLVYRDGKSSNTISPKKLYKIYKSSTEFFSALLKKKVPHIFQGSTSTKTFVRAAREYWHQIRSNGEKELHAHLKTAISFREKFSRRLPDGGDDQHRYFVKILKECESILFPPTKYVSQSGVERIDPERFKVNQSAEHILYDSHSSEVFETSSESGKGGLKPGRAYCFTVQADPESLRRIREEALARRREEEENDSDEEEEDYPLSLFFDEDGACLDEEDILSMDTTGFFED